MVIITKIHNKYYNIENFKHHGGGDALWHSFGRDSTAMFEMYHPFVSKDKLQSILKKYEVSADKAKPFLLQGEDGVPQFEFDTEFSKEIKQEVYNYFQEEAKKNNTTIRKITKASTSRWILIGFLNLFRILSIFWWVSGSIYGLFAFPLLSWLNVMIFHDACHFSLSDKPFINKIFSFSLFDFTFPTVWYYQHNISHHSYTNIVNKDVDLYHGSYISRETKEINYKSVHKFQYLFFLIKWFLYYSTVIVNFIRGLFGNKIFKIIYKNDKYSIVETFLVLLFFYTRYILVLNYINIYSTVIPTFIFGFLFMLNSQITHLHEDTFHNEKDWYKHQVLTSSNHSIGSYFGYFFSGGLNHQIEHHLFPGVNHCHYPYIQPIVERVCEKHNIKYKKFDGYYQAFCSYYKHIVALSFCEKKK